MSRVGWLCAGALLPAMMALAGAPARDAAAALAAVEGWFEPLPAGGGFAARGVSGSLRLDGRGAWLGLPDGKGGTSGALHLRLAAARATEPEGLEPTGAATNYIVARRGMPQGRVKHFAKVRYPEAYPGIDVVYYSRGGQLEYDFHVQPGADPAGIAVSFDGARSVRIEDGTLVVRAGGGEIRQPAPVVYQLAGGETVLVEARYTLRRNGAVGFELGTYDRSLPLVIDPVLTYARYLGGTRLEVANALALDAQGNLWVAGSGTSDFAPAQAKAPLKTDRGFDRDAFVAKLRPTAQGLRLEYWTYLGGSAEDEANALAIDFRGHVVLAGATGSLNWPLGGNAYQTEAKGDFDAFVARINPDAAGVEALEYSSYYGGPGREIANAVAVSRDGAIAIAGSTVSGQLNGVVQGTATQAFNRGGWDIFVASFQPNRPTAAETFLGATFYGGNSTDIANAAAFDGNGIIWITGTTLSDDFPTAGSGSDTAQSGHGDIFLVGLDFSKTEFDALVYGAYVGGSDLDVASAMYRDAGGQFWITGYTFSNDLPVTASAYRARSAGGADAFLLRLDPRRAPSQMVTYGSYLGGRGGDVAYALAPAGNGRIALAGYTTSRDFPQREAVSEILFSLTEMFVSVIDTNRSGEDALVESFLYGGALADVATGIAVDPAGNLYIAGFSSSQTLALVDGGKPTERPGFYSGVILEVRPR